jgi:hypothetical protein
MGVLQAHRCLKAETKHLAIRGVEDDFSSNGVETTEPHPRLAGLPIRITSSRHQLVQRATYDDLREDTQFWDHILVPAKTVSGILVVKLRPVGDTTTDSLEIGDFTTRLTSVHPSKAKLYIEEIGKLASSGVWTRQGEVYWAKLSDLRMNQGGRVIDLIASASGEAILDVSLGDDTAVDFLGLAACAAPDRTKGLTMYRIRPASRIGEDYVSFDCQPDVAGERGCDPFVGDTPCQTELPLLCVAGRDLPNPPVTSIPQGYMVERMWSGGEFAATRPVPASRFKTIADADAYCASVFGADFRTAEWHIGGPGWRFAGAGKLPLPEGRFWIDIRGQPYGTCWRRRHER